MPPRTSQPVPTLTREQVRRVDQIAIEEYGMSGLVLMENAGRGAVDVLESLGIAGPVVVCCGGGNNAGDGFVVARHLDLRGYDVRVLLCLPADKLQGDAAANFAILRKTAIAIVELAEHPAPEAFDAHFANAHWLIDALLGTGASGDPRPPLDAAIEAMNRAKKNAAPNRPTKILALDLPSGLDCDTGQPGRPTVEADATCTFAAAKPGFFTPAGKRYVGEWRVCDIGAPREILERAK